jgi:SAM-dependent methyltransferase
MFAQNMTEEQENQLRQKAKNQLDSFLAECGIKDFRGKRIFEVGYKNGLFLDECHKAGLVPVGLEINKTYCETVKAQFPHLEALLYDGGTFPVSDASFDFVVSFQVLEHVCSIEHILSECIRVLKPGGVMYHVCPNYFSFYEGHYGVIWLPFLNKSLGRLYLKLFRSDLGDEFENLNFIKPRAITRALKTFGENIKVVSLGRAEFVNRFNRQQIEKVNQKFLRAVLKIILAIPLLKDILLRLVARANLYYPITVIARRL